MCSCTVVALIGRPTLISFAPAYNRPPSLLVLSVDKVSLNVVRDSFGAGGEAVTNCTLRRYTHAPISIRPVITL